MSLLQTTLDAIRPVDTTNATTVAKRLASVLEGDDNTLGELRQLLLRYINITGQINPPPPKKCTIICCADHGVAQEGVSAYPPETTLQMTKNYLINRGGAANALAGFANSELFVCDLGIAADTSDIPELIQVKIANGTQNMAKGPAMSREQAILALETGIRIAEKAFAAGYNCLLPGEMGIANTTSSAAICAVCCNLPAETVTGRGTNISDERLQKKIGVVKQILAINSPNPHDGIDILSKVGGFELGAIAGLMLAAAAQQKTVILDGANTSAAALIAQALAPQVTDYLLASHQASEKSHQFMLQKLGVTPIMQLDFRLGEACGSSILIKLLEAALKLWDTIAKLPQDPIETPFKQEYAAKLDSKITDKTFDFYLHTMQDLDREAMTACQQRLNNLAKPIYSLGYLEQIALEFAGVVGDELPPIQQDAALLILTGQKNNSLAAQLTATMTNFANMDVTMAHIRDNISLTAAFDFGRQHGEYLSMTYPLIGLAITEPDENTPLGTTGQELTASLLNDDGSLKYSADTFLQYAPKHLQPLIGSLIGAIIAAAHNSSFIILDDPVTEIVARYTALLCPDVRPYILHVQPALLQTNITAPGGIIASLGVTIVSAALHILNNMRTFAETKVSIANDGPGALHQISN